MATVFDVAIYIIEKQKSISAMKLHKLVYYTQAWSLVWDNQPLFKEEIQAWANGPVVPKLYQIHKGKYSLKNIEKGNSKNLTNTAKETIDAVLTYYGKKSSQWLSDLTHMEAPWKEARQGIADGDPSQKVISHASMEEYYSSLPPR